MTAAIIQCLSPRPAPSSRQKAQGKTAALRDLFRRRASVRLASPDEILVPAGEAPAFVGLLVSGVLRCQGYSCNGTPRLTGLIYPGEVIGLGGAAPLDASIEVSARARIACIRRDVFDSLVATDVALARACLEVALAKAEADAGHILLLGINDRRTRVAAYLAALVDSGFSGADGARRCVIEVPIPRKDVAAYLGIAVETVSRALHALEAEGIVEILAPHRFRIPDLERLRAAAGEGDERPVVGPRREPRVDGGQCNLRRDRANWGPGDRASKGWADAEPAAAGTSI